MAVRKILSQPMISNITLDKLYDNKEKYTVEVDLQRKNAWTYYQKSNLINSLLTDYPVPQIICNIKEGMYRILDGGNRIRAILGFLENGYKISEGIEDIADNDEVYKIEGLDFNSFPEKLQKLLMTKMIEIKFYTDLTYEEEAEIILRSNSGSEMKPIEKARVQNHKNGIQDFVKEIVSNELFIRKVNIANFSKDRFANEQLVYSVLYFECGITDEVATSNYEKIGKTISDNNLLTDEIKDKIKTTIEYLNLVFPAKAKFLNLKNFIPIYMLCETLLDRNINERKAYSYIEGFFNIKDENYDSIRNSKWGGKSAVQKRYEILKRYIDNCICTNTEQNNNEESTNKELA